MKEEAEADVPAACRLGYRLPRNDLEPVTLTILNMRRSSIDAALSRRALASRLEHCEGLDNISLTNFTTNTQVRDSVHSERSCDSLLHWNRTSTPSRSDPNSISLSFCICNVHIRSTGEVEGQTLSPATLMRPCNTSLTFILMKREWCINQGTTSSVPTKTHGPNSCFPTSKLWALGQTY